MHNRGHWSGWAPRPVAGAAGGAGGGAGGSGGAGSAGLRLRGRQLLDHEALSCLLVLLFIDEPKLNTTRLHRVLRNLCYHGATRDWVVKSLLSILERSNEVPASVHVRVRFALRWQALCAGPVLRSMVQNGPF